jgi:hypothetical protein
MERAEQQDALCSGARACFWTATLRDVRFSNRPVGVKRLQVVQRCSEAVESSRTCCVYATIRRVMFTALSPQNRCLI